MARKPSNKKRKAVKPKAPKKNGEVSPKLTEKKAIEKLEAGEIGTEQFLANLKPDDELGTYWGDIYKLTKRRRTFRNTDLLRFAKRWNISGRKREHVLNSTRGIVNKFVEWKALSVFRSGTHINYLCNLPEFYNAEELLKLIPSEDISRVLKPLQDGPMTLGALEQVLERVTGAHVLETILTHYVDEGAVEIVKKPAGAFKLTDAAKITGTDPNSLGALKLFQAENLLDQDEDTEAQRVDPQDTRTLARMVREDLESKIVPTRVISAKGESVRIVSVGEVRLGNQFTDLDFFLFGQEQIERVKPDVVVASGFVQGDHRSYQVERLRAMTKAALLNKLGSQYKHADRLLRDFEKGAERVFYLQSDDDWNIAKSRTLIAMKGLLGLRRAGLSSLFPEEIARLSGRDYVDYLQKQWEYVQPYMWRIGRTLLNKNEVNEIAPHLNKDEFLLILMVLLFKKFNHEIPEDFRKVVDVEALFGDRSGSKRCVTPDPLFLRFDFDNGKSTRVQWVHNFAYSDVTQYLDSLFAMEKSFRQLQARGVETPDFVFDFQQERFFGANVGGCMMFNLPGCQNPSLAAERRMKTFNTQIVGEKSHKQITVRKEPVSPGITDFQIFEDGRFKFRVLNNTVRRIIENSKRVPEVKGRVALFQDIQIGSPTMRLEWFIKGLDIALYGPDPVDDLIINGDLIHGFSVYAQFVPESRIKRLVSIKSQQAMAERVMMPFFPAPTVKRIKRVMGNHEWDNKGVKHEGADYLSFLESGLRNRYSHYNEGYKQAVLDSGFKGKIEDPYKDIEITSHSRGRTVNSGNPEGGGTVHWPYFTQTIAGDYRYAVQHKWQPFGGGGRTAVDKQIKWMTNMARAARGINVMLGGHWHYFSTAMVSDILMLQIPGLVDQSGYEVGFGHTPLSWFCMLEFSNHTGITVEMYPMTYLVDYQCRSPFYKDKNELLVRPKPGTREYKHGFDSPLIHQWEEEIDSEHIEI